MPVDKNKLIRFQALDRCFSDQSSKYYIEDLISACNRALENADCEYKSISRSSIYSDITEMTTNPNWPGANLMEKAESLDGKRRYYRYKDSSYSIWKRDISDSQLAQLQSIMLMLRQFRDFPLTDAIEKIIHQFEKQYRFTLDDAEGIIAFESNENIEALSLVSVLFSHISHKNILEITYQPFNQHSRKYVVHPHFLKQYNRRWFLIGYTISESNEKNRSVFALDRIESIEQIAGEYMSSDKDLDELFYDQIGVTLTTAEPVKVKLQFTPNRYNYVLTKPIHLTQRNVQGEDGVISITVRPNKELFQTLLSFGPDVTVVEPEYVKIELKQLIQKMQDTCNCPE